ncbi:MAG TPA: DUF4062 domain-containing protein [Blastocatellia bacterium]|nr:DUF4062 domain-containing protein [Blastocatellia bacterium]
MVNGDLHLPLQFKGVMISSTFTDLKDHRAALIKAINGQGLTDVVMENDSAKPGLDVIDSSLQMVRNSTAYICVISRKYGQTPKCSKRNPGNLSLTELEFNEAQRLNRPILLFIMGEKHPLIEADVETNRAKKKKLEAFRARAKNMGPDSFVHRVYANFDSLDEFKEKAIHAVANLRRYLESQPAATSQPAHSHDRTKPDPIPAPPAFYAEPPYIGSHRFLGRKAQLDTLNDWASPADSHPILLFEAIGGAGKSLLTWEWTIKHATKARKDWAGRFWYSFYEKGAVMSDFCQRALAYMTGEPLREFRKKKIVELSELLLLHLQAQPWLLILDGLERVLVAYHRFDAAQVLDEEAGTTDQIAHRDPCAAIRPEDDDLLRALAAASPSKLLITSRLIPRVLLNAAGQPIPGVLHERLPGLRPAEAEALLRSCDITGNSQEIQNYLKRHCDCHALVTGVLAGLINEYLPDRRNFDAWAADPDAGGYLNLANLDLIQKRNHILHAALAALPEKSRQLLSTLALLSEAVDYLTLSALNPHLPPEPEEVKEPRRPEVGWRWERMSDDEKELAQQDYQTALQRRKDYEQAVKARQQPQVLLAASQYLAKTVLDLEHRGLLQYDNQTKRYDLHPVVRGIAAGGLRQEEKDLYGQRVVDHFTRQAHNPYEQAETLEDLRDSLQVVRTLLQMGRYQQACDAFPVDLDTALTINLEAHTESLALLRPFFPHGWATMPEGVTAEDASFLANSAANALSSTDAPNEALTLYGTSLLGVLRRTNWASVRTSLRNICLLLSDQNCLAKCERIINLALDIATLANDKPGLFTSRLSRFRQLRILGQFEEAEAVWQVLDPMGRSWSRLYYIPGEAEISYGWFRFYRGDLREEHLAVAEQLAKAAKYRGGVRNIYRLRGMWQIELGQWSHAADSFLEAIRMAREVGQSDATSETLLALAKFRLGQLHNPRHEAEQLSKAKRVSHQDLAELWLAIGDPDQAKKHALEAYNQAWADGEPYVLRYYLNKARSLLEQLDVEIPKLPPYDPAKDEKLFWEDELTATIEELRAEEEDNDDAELNDKE